MVQNRKRGAENTGLELNRCASTPVPTNGCSFSASGASDDDADDGADAVALDDASSPPTSAANPDDAAQSPNADAAELCEVCLIARRSGVALVPCSHSRFCGTCTDHVHFAAAQ